MSNKFKDISTKNHTYYFFDDIINIKTFDPKVVQNILTYYIGYVAMKDLYKLIV